MASKGKRSNTDNIGSRNNAVGIATGYGAGRPSGQSSGPGRSKIVLFFFAQNDSGAHPASYPMGTGGSFAGV
jgi:hypothetical protein